MPLSHIILKQLLCFVNPLPSLVHACVLSLGVEWDFYVLSFLPRFFLSGSVCVLFSGFLAGSAKASGAVGTYVPLRMQQTISAWPVFSRFAPTPPRLLPPDASCVVLHNTQCTPRGPISVTLVLLRS